MNIVVANDRYIDDFERILGQLEDARSFGKAVYQSRLLAAANKLLAQMDGARHLAALAPRFAAAGVFAGTDWDQPDRLQSALVRGALTAGDLTPALELLSEMRFLALAEGQITDPAVSPARARTFLEDVLARNLDFLFPEATEVSRQLSAVTQARIASVFTVLLEHLGGNGILASLIAECQRILMQRPVMVERVETMLNAARKVLLNEQVEDNALREQAQCLLLALDGPGALAQQHPDASAYAMALAHSSAETLAAEADAFGRSMDDTGLVSTLHAVLLRHLVAHEPGLLIPALALNPVGQTSLSQHPDLVADLVQDAVTPATARCIYGLSRLLNRGILFYRPVGPGLKRLSLLPIRADVAAQLQQGDERADAPSANTRLLAATLSVIGQPRGVDQGHNPTCQAARAISLWSQNDIGYLLELIARAARDGDIVMHFEGQPIRSSDLVTGLATELHPELDAVSLVLTPHLDRIYIEMGRRAIGRDADGHKWINPAFHGWWVYRAFASLVDPATGAVMDFDRFMRLFFAAYHPLYNGGRDLVYAQPCGIVSTDANAQFVGWHAVSIQRIAMDPYSEWRVYFFNPNRDKGQNWGQGIVTSTHGHGEHEGESSLPFAQFLMRLYVFHYTRRELGDPDLVPADALAPVRDIVAAGWAAGREWRDQT